MLAFLTVSPTRQPHGQAVKESCPPQAPAPAAEPARRAARQGGGSAVGPARSARRAAGKFSLLQTLEKPQNGIGIGPSSVESFRAPIRPQLEDEARELRVRELCLAVPLTRRGLVLTDAAATLFGAPLDAGSILEAGTLRGA